MLTVNVVQKIQSFDFVLEKEGFIYIVADSQSALKIRDEYLNNLYLKPFASLKNAVNISLLSDTCAMVYKEGVAYFSCIGNSVIEIVRNGESKIILTGEEEVKSASGYPKEGDLIILKSDQSKISLKFEKKSLFSSISGKREVFLKEQKQEEVSPQSKKLTLILGIGLLVILSISVIAGVYKKRALDAKAQYEGILTQSQENLDKAISLASESPEESRNAFTLASEGLKKIEELKVNDQKVTDLKNKIDESRESILGEYRGASELFLDLGLLSSGFKGDTLVTSNGNVFILDIAGKRVVSVEMSTKKSKVVAGPTKIDNATDLASYEDSVYTIEGDGIYQIDETKQKVVEKTWDGLAFSRVFGGNMYVLDKSANAIYRHPGNSEGFGEKQSWLSSDTQVNFNEVKMFAIDGAIYVLYPNSRILKYSQGVTQAFRLLGIVPEIGNIDAIYADPNNTYLYLLDRAGKRVVVTDKRGTYKAQYFDDQIENAINLAVSEESKKIILLTGEKLLQIEIRH